MVPVRSLSFQKKFRGHPHVICESSNVCGIQVSHNVVVGPLSSLCSSHGLTHMLCLLLGLCMGAGGGGGGAGPGGAGCCGRRKNWKYMIICN